MPNNQPKSNQFISLNLPSFWWKARLCERRISGATARDSLAQSNGLGLNVVSDSANLQRRTINACERTGEVGMQFGLDCGREDAVSIFCAEH